MPIIIDAINVVKAYGEGELQHTVLKNISLQIEEGEFVAIMGRSGAGKSTLMYQLSLLDRPTEGEIILDGVYANTLEEDERTRFRLHNLGYVFQDYALMPELTALENVAVPLLMQGKSKKEAYEKATVALDSVSLAERLMNLPSQLSGGEQQRVSIARSIAHGPKILFADEPTANLDSETSRQVLGIFRELNDKGQTIVMVTHEKEFGLLADRIITVQDGNIVSYR
ncbi:MAG: ABC transporter [Candidatus Lloydbacteria bacterium RIFOXYC12_FULL_46_25]|uniref:ABC transporter n=1 Tax=Candidatus Lloydbacteria bacterium RIFOXYC12_FULL_46_25 TaxID=1798670 RepID=A0A1G2DXM0_9BACT|nr:MAG: ABC transporter [Candidatus Lloydbacteria bacterium RIFOXYC12_FULL_46_25]